MLALRRLVPILALAVSPSVAWATATSEADPAVYLQAFNETCRHGFPDVDAIAREAVSRGWAERAMRPISGPPDLLARLPRAFGRNGLMLFLNKHPSGGFSTVCQVTGSATTRLTGRDIAAIVAPSLNAGEPTPGAGDAKKNDYTMWTVAPGTLVQAGVNGRDGKTRTISIAMLQAQAVSVAQPVVTPPKHPGRDIPMVAIGLPFSPENPTPVDTAHPLYHGLTIGEIADLPSSVKSSVLNWIPAAKRSSVNAALRESFARMNLLAPDAASARKRLTVSWKGDQTPFHIGTRNATAVTLHYRLTRIDNGMLLFDRDITTGAKGGGADASMRDNGIVRAAIAANFASAANCIDRAAYGTAPADCALTPQFEVSVVRLAR